MPNTIIYKEQSKVFVDVKPRKLKAARTIKMVFEAGFRTFLVLTLIITVLTVLTSNTDKVMNIKSFTVLSGSMEPTIGTGSIIYTHKNLGYNLGDIITFKNASGQTVTHRIIAIENNGEVLYHTKGDANSAGDQEAVTVDKIIGKTYFALPYIGRATMLLKTPQGLFTTVVIPAILVIAYELWTIKKELEKSVERKILERIRKQGGAHTHSLWPESTS